MSSSSSSRPADAGESIKVVVRCRPLSSTEQRNGQTSVVAMDSKLSAVTVTNRGSDAASTSSSAETSKTFTFDAVYPPGTAQRQIFAETARPIVQSVLEGYNGTIFAYGQTGTGKTFTMEGEPADAELRGVMPNAFEHVFAAVAAAPANVEFLVRASFLEVYREDVFDLLHPRQKRQKLALKGSSQTGWTAEGLTSEPARSPADLLRLLREGQAQRRVGATEMNPDSSRSHSIFTIIVESSTTDPTTGAPTFRQGKLNLVDLAGSERLKKTNAEGERLEEAKFISQSLSALGNVIRALAEQAKRGAGASTGTGKEQPQGHVPYRGSALTMLLRDSLGGNTKTVMIAAVGPAASNYSETLSTLFYANQAKQIKNKPKVNEDAQDAQLREMKEEMALLQARILARRRGIDFASLTREQQLALGQRGVVPAGGEGEGEGEEVIKVRIVDSGLRMEDLERVIAEARREEAEMTHKTEAERREILRRKAEAESKWQALDAELRRNQELLAREEAETGKLARELEARQEELVKGGGRVEQAALQKRELEAAEEELQRRRQEQERLVREREEREEAKLLMDESYASVEAEKQAVQRKLRTLFARWEGRKEELEAAREAFDREREDLIDTLHALDRQIKLRSLMIESFMPYSFYRQVDRARRWDEFAEQWVLPGLQFGGNSAERHAVRAAVRGDGDGDGDGLGEEDEGALDGESGRTGRGKTSVSAPAVVTDALQVRYLAAGTPLPEEHVFYAYPPQEEPVSATGAVEGRRR